MKYSEVKNKLQNKRENYRRTCSVLYQWQVPQHRPIPKITLADPKRIQYVPLFGRQRIILHMLLRHPPATPEKIILRIFIKRKSETPDKLCQKQSSKKIVLEKKAKWQRT
jgi:hypothetical protein